MHKREGTIKRKSATRLGSLAAVVLSSGCSDTHFRVFYQATDPLPQLYQCLSCIGSIN